MKQKVEFIESYIKNGTGDYQWNGNHGELVRCKDCKHGDPCNDGEIYCEKDIGTIKTAVHKPDWFCADGTRKEGRDME